LIEAVEKTGATQNWIQNWTYDRYGNRTAFTQNIAGNTAAVNPTVDINTNRFVVNQGFSYDPNGNVVNDVDAPTGLSRSFTFNGDNKQTEVKRNGVTVGRYFYDGEGKRIKKITDAETTIFVYSAGKLVAEYSTATPPQNPTIAYTTKDHLGSPRIITDAFGQVKSRRDFMPFGEELNAGIGARTGDTGLKYSSTADNIRQKFTTYHRDNETSLDFAEARMYENRFGRFTAVDPLLASGKSANPQTFNRYVYVGNRPLVKIDPSGQIMGDYYDIHTGRYIGSDGRPDDLVYVGETAKAKIEKGKIVSTEGFKFFDTKHSQFQSSAHIVKAEGLSSDFKEYQYIAHTGNNEARATGTYLHQSLDKLSTAPKGSLSTTDNSTTANFARKAVFDVLLGNPDPTGGARRWDGVDFLAWGLKSPNGTPHNKFEEYSKIRIGGDIFADFRNALLSKYQNGKAGYGTTFYNIPADVFNDSANWSLASDPSGGGRFMRHTVFQFSTGVANAPALRATAAAGYSIFWAIDR